MSKYRGGLYAWRTDKPHAIIGLPFIGRHWAYGGMTNSYYFRGQQHLTGSTKYGKAAANWSDLRPKCYRILPLPDWLLKSRNVMRRRLVRALETAMIWLLCPVYNIDQQAPYNLRRIPPWRAAAQRKARDELGKVAKVAKFAARMCFWAVLSAIVLIGFVKGWWTA